MKMNWVIFSVGMYILLFFCSGVLYPEPSLTSARELSTIEDVIVTAQKREENIQDVPISMSVFNEYAINEKNIKSIRDIASYTSNLLLNDNGGRGSLSPTIRGLHTETGSFSPSIVMFVDGVPAIGTTGFDTPLTDIDRIEVLKGPQGTLYGKGSETGVINVITKKPGNAIEGNVSLETGSDNKREGTLTVRAPLVKDKFYIGISGRHYQKDGFLRNMNIGGYSDDREHNYGKINLRYTPIDAFDISLISSALRHDDGGLTWGPKGASRINASNDESIKLETYVNAFKVEFERNDYRFESITTQTRTNDIAQLDYDYTPGEDYDMHSNSKLKNTSQEFRLKRNFDGFNWLFGVNFTKDDHLLDYVIHFYGYDMPTYARLEGESLGAFTNLTYEITKSLTLEGGIRYDRNKNQHLETDKQIDLASTSSAVSPKMALTYKPSNSAMFYTTIAKGYRPAGFYPYAPEGYSYRFGKETLWSYEFGSKHRFLGDRLAMNTAFYYMKIDDMQVTSSIADSSYTYKSNAARATSKGVECDLTYLFNKGLEFFFSVGCNNTTFDAFADETGNYSGKKNPFAPEYNYNVGAQYRAESGGYARLDVNGYGDMYLDKENAYKRDAYHLINLKTGYETDRYDIYVYGKNVCDEEYDSVGYSNNFTIYSSPREIGIQMTLRF